MWTKLPHVQIVHHQFKQATMISELLMEQGIEVDVITLPMNATKKNVHGARQNHIERPTLKKN